MVPHLRFLGCFLLYLACAESIRSRRARGAAPSTKFIAGVPILNYEAAGGSSLSELTGAERDWVVVVNPGTTDDEILRMCSANKNSCNLVGHPSKGGVPFFELRGTEEDLKSVVHVGKGAVKLIEPDQEVHMIPEIESAAVESTRTWGLARIGAGQRSRSGAGSTIFILDTGVRSTHQEFSGRSSPALDLTRGSLEECNGDFSCAFDRQGHGTHCAGTAAGVTFGVAPGARVKAVKVLSDAGSGQWSWSFAALDWIATNQDRPAVASMSLGGYGAISPMKDAVDAAVNAGAIVVVAAGNSNDDACDYSPAFVPSAITVGASDASDWRAYFSNYGRCTNIWAPGVGIESADYADDTWSLILSGTSMACPHVAGGAALVLEADPSKKASAVLETLHANAADGVLRDLNWELDTNKLLYVGEGGAPPSPPWTTTTTLPTTTTTTTTLYPNCSSFCRKDYALHQCIMRWCKECPWCQ